MLKEISFCKLKTFLPKILPQIAFSKQKRKYNFVSYLMDLFLSGLDRYEPAWYLNMTCPETEGGPHPKTTRQLFIPECFDFTTSKGPFVLARLSG